MLRAYSFIVLHGEPHSRTTTFVPSPAIPSSRHPWTLLILIEIDSQEKKTDAVIQSMISEIQARYEAARVASGEEALIEVCRKFNENANLLTRKNQAWYKRLHLAIAVVDGPTLLLAIYGNMRAYLWHKGRSLDIQKTVPPESARGARSSFKIFTSLLEGKLADGDKLLLSCPHLFDYFSVEKIQSLIRNKSASDASQYLARMLKDLPGNVSVSAVMAESVPETAPKAIPRPALSANQSMAELNSLEAHTAQLLTNSLAKNVRRVVQYIRPPRATTSSTVPLPEDRMWQKKLLDQGARYARRIAAFMAVRMRALFLAIMPRRNADVAMTATFISARAPVKPHSALHIAAHALLARFRRLPRSSQYLFIGAILLALLFIESIVTIANQRIRSQEREAFAADSASIEQMLNEAEASLIYNDEEKARRIWKDASATLTNLRARGDKETAQEQRLETRLHTLQHQVFHTRVIENPNTLINLAQFSEGETPVAPGGLIGPSAEFILSYSSRESMLFIIEPSSGSVTIATPDTPEALTLIRGAAGDNGVFYLVTAQSFARFNARERVYSPLHADAARQDIADIAVFGPRLYTLNRATGAIARYDFTDDGLNPAVPWFAAGTSVPGATAFAINGSIYVADAAGAIRKFTRGEEQEFTVGAIEPPLRTPSRLAVDSQYLYALEPTERRIVILNKDGTLHEQITSPSFDRLIDMVVNPPRKLIYVLNGTIVYSIPFPQ